MVSRRIALRALAFVVVSTLSWSLWASCADAAVLTQHAQMACCKDGEMACAPNGSASDCCKTDAAQSRDAVSGQTIKLVHHLSAIVVAWAILPDILTLNSSRVGARESASPPQIAPGPPPYIAFSSLLI